MLGLKLNDIIKRAPSFFHLDDHLWKHYGDVIMATIASAITSLTIVYSTVYSGADQREHQSSASLAFVRGIHRGPVNSPHKWPVTRKMFPFDDVIMTIAIIDEFSTLSNCDLYSFSLQSHQDWNLLSELEDIRMKNERQPDYPRRRVRGILVVMVKGLHPN